MKTDEGEGQGGVELDSHPYIDEKGGEVPPFKSTPSPIDAHSNRRQAINMCGGKLSFSTRTQKPMRHVESQKGV